MGILDWWRRRKAEQKREAESIKELRRVDEPAMDTPAETYMSQTRD